MNKVEFIKYAIEIRKECKARLARKGCNGCQWYSVVGSHCAFRLVPCDWDFSSVHKESGENEV